VQGDRKRRADLPLLLVRSGAVTDDLRCALAFLSHFAPHAPLYGIGFSLGANQMAKLVGEDAESSPLNAAVVLGAPFDFVKGHVSLSSSWIRLVYSRAMGKNLKCVISSCSPQLAEQAADLVPLLADRTLLTRHAAMLKTHPKLDWSAIHDNPYTSLFEFDALVTAPLAGFVRPSRRRSRARAPH